MIEYPPLEINESVLILRQAQDEDLMLSLSKHGFRRRVSGIFRVLAVLKLGD
jgi:hypothetical protein